MKRRDTLVILIPSFIFAIFWIGFSIYHNVITSTISQPLSVQIQPITPAFDTNAIDGLKKRETVTPLYELSASTQNPAAPASPSAGASIVTPIPSEISTGSAQATAGGGLTQ